MRLGTPGGTTLLRRYNIVSGHWPQFIALWEKVVALRRRHGFEILFALKDENANIFTWAVRYHGDIDAAMEVYYKDPDRVALEIIGEHVADYDVTVVEEVEIPAD